jgi:2,3-diketo-5-methylthio-1-phosphopentane phosphatase
MSGLELPTTPPAWHVLCDFDHTITREDVTDGLLERFANPAWAWLESAWREDRLDARDCMAAQVALMQAALHELDAYLDGVEIDPAFARFAAFCGKAGVGLEVVSDGLDYAVHRVLQRHGLAHLPVIANRLQMLDHGRWAMSPRHAGADCRGRQGVCKCAVARTSDARTNQLLIGDGRSDFCVADQVDLVFARDGLLAHCRDNGIPHRPISNFGDALSALQQLLAEPIPALSVVRVAHA